MEQGKFLLQDELSDLQKLSEEFNKIKLRIADVEIEKQVAFKMIENLRSEFSAYEKKLIDKYGADAVINLKTGEITKKEQ